MTAASSYRVDQAGLTFAVRAVPKASSAGILGVMATPKGLALKVAVTVAADKGKANAAVLALITKTFHVAKSDVTLISGATDRRKVVQVAGDPAKLAAIADQWSLI